GSEKAARGTVAARCANDHFAFCYAWRHCQRLLVLNPGDAGFPHGLAGLGVERLQAPVVDWDIDLVSVQRESAAHDATAHLVARGLAVHLRIPAPFFFARARIDGEHDAPVGDAKYRVVPHER